jgi:fatty acid desaturase
MATTMLPRSMIPAPERLPLVLPTDRITKTGLAIPELRAELRKIANVRNAITVTLAFVQCFGSLMIARLVVDRTGWFWLWIPMFFLQGRAHALMGILSHEGTHRLLFSSQKMNDFVGGWLIAPISFSSQEGYRRSHMAHHRDPLGPNEPDKSLYANYPMTMARFRTRLRRDLTGESGLKILRGILRGAKNPVARPAFFRMISAQIILAVVLGFTVGWWAWLLMWFVPYMTVWRVLNRLRAVAEHAGMGNSKDERVTTHHVRQGWLPRFWIAPYNTGWHVAHHVDAGIPWRNLPRFHKELEAAGYMTNDLEYPNYRALWRALASADVA